jgi:uncharacterized Zn finger protein
MSTAFDEAWATDDRPGYSQDELIQEFARLDALVKETAKQRKEISARLTEIALENKKNQNTVRLASTDGQQIKVEFGIDYEFENDQMFTAAELLGKDAFDELFKTEVKFTAKKRNLNGFLNTVPSDERTRTAKQIIQDAMHEKDKTPYVSMV